MSAIAGICAAITENPIQVPQRIAHQAREGEQHLVPYQVAIVVIDALEMIDIEHGQIVCLALVFLTIVTTGSGCKHFAQLLFQLLAVIKAGQGVALAIKQ